MTVNMKKKRVLVTISFSFSIRYLVRSKLIHKMKAFCEPVIVITWNQADLVEELRNEGFEVHVVPESNRGMHYSDIRKKLDYWFRYFKLKSPTWAIEPRYLEQFRPWKIVLLNRIREYYNFLKFYIPGYTAKVFQKEKALLVSDTNYSDMEKLVDQLQLDAAFVVTPFHAQEDLLLRAAEAKGVYMITSILSFDNIVKRGWIPVKYKHWMVWNDKMKSELMRIYPESVSEKNVHVVGAVQFDFYKHPEEYLMEEAQWRQLVGLPPKDHRKVILFAGGPVSLFPQEYQFLQHIDAAITSGAIEGNPIVLFRCHPIDRVERWKEALGNTPNVFFDTSWTGSTKLTYTNIKVEDITKLFSTLYHTDVHVNTCSTMTVDGSAFNKPQIGPAYDELAKPRKYDLKSMYYQEYFLPVMETKGLAHAYNKKELINYVNDALKNPEAYVKKSKAIVEAIVTYTDGGNGDRVASALEQILR